MREASLAVDRRGIPCPRCGVPMSFIRGRTEVTIDGMRHSLQDFWCSQHGLWHYDIDTEELNQKGSSDLDGI